MTRRSKIWLAVAVLFTVINLAGAVFAAVRAEVLHASTHVVLTLLGAYAVWRLAPRHSARRLWRRGEAGSPAIAGELSDRLTHLEHAVDAVAIEVERIGEGQRFITRSCIENASPRAPGEGTATSSEGSAQEAESRERRD